LKTADKQCQEQEKSVQGYERDLEGIKARALAFEQEADKLDAGDTPMLDDAGIAQYAELYGLRC
jgi:hypothetical protein